MSYTAPSGTAVNFSFVRKPYVAPSGSGTNFSFASGGSTTGTFAPVMVVSVNLGGT